MCAMLLPVPPRGWAWGRSEDRSELAPTLPAPGLQKERTWVLDMSWTSASQGQGVVKGGYAGCRAGAEF